MMDNLLVATGLFLLMNIILIGLIFWEARKIKEHNEIMTMFIDSNAEIFTVINGNAAIQREHIKRTDKIETVIAYYATVLDAHAHALSVYGPAMTFSKNKLSDSVQDLKNFGE